MSGKYLDLSALQKAILSLEEAVQELKRQPKNKFIRDATIQRFEYTYELTHKMLRRYFELTEPNPSSADQMSFPALIRTGSERGLLLNGWDKWTDYRDARNMTSHGYDEEKAMRVSEKIPFFLEDAKYLLSKLGEKNSLS